MTDTSTGRKVAATNFVAVTKMSSPRVNSFLGKVLNAGEDQMKALARLNEVSAAIQTLLPILNKEIGKASIPEIDCSEIDDQIKAIDSQLKEFSSKADSASAEIDKQIEVLKAKRDEVRKPILDGVEVKAKERSELVVKRTELFAPQREAIEELISQLKKLGDEEVIEVLLQIDAPSMASAPKSSVSSPGKTGRHGSVIVSKDGTTRNFSSLNKAYTTVYTEIEGKESTPRNSAQCSKWLENKGYSIEFSE